MSQSQSNDNSISLSGVDDDHGQPKDAAVDDQCHHNQQRREIQNSLSSLETDPELNITEVATVKASSNVPRIHASRADSQKSSSSSWWPSSFRRIPSSTRAAASVEISALTSVPQQQTLTNKRHSTTAAAAAASGGGMLRKSYQPGEYVLIHTSTLSTGITATTCVVNQFGFPPGHGDTVAERSGPYVYVWAKVQTLHYEEFHPYYTVRRLDTRSEVRADASQLESIQPTPALLRILYQQEHQQQQNRTNSRSRLFFGNKNNDATTLSHNMQAHSSAFLRTYLHPDPEITTANTCWQNICHYLLDIPYWWFCVCIPHLCCRPCVQSVVRSSLGCFRNQARLFLYGYSPYVCQMRLTMVNFVVLCSTWFMFSDQIRLAFFSESADFPLAVINLVVWCVLVLELLFQVFIRPDRYSDLVISDKAFAPTTIRYINGLHLFVEALSLAIFVSEFLCIFTGESCSARNPFSFYNAALMTLIGPTRKEAFFGYAFIALIRLRVFGVVRQWRNMWITKTFIDMKWKSDRSGILSNIVPRGTFRSSFSSKVAADKSELELNKKSSVADMQSKEHKTKDAALTNASNIGTALMSSNSHRALAIAWCIMGLFPVVTFIVTINDMTDNLTAQLQSTNLLASDDGNQTCQFFTDSLATWVMSINGDRLHIDEYNPLLLSLDVQPYRCGFDGTGSANIQICRNLEQSIPELPTHAFEICNAWYRASDNFTTDEEIAHAFNARVGSVIKFVRNETANFTYYFWGVNVTMERDFIVEARFDQTFSLRVTSIASLILQFCLLLSVLGGLSFLRRDAEVFVLGPLRRMLKIVARYARNPLVPPKIKRRRLSGNFGPSRRSEDSDSSSCDDSRNAVDDDELELGSFETEQLINAIAKITDLLRKCWGVAGADIISTNLATEEGTLTEVFNPTVPGKSVYALFAFAAIGGFDDALRNLGGDVMPLINDVAAVLHREVFRWGFGDSGQCNKNLGGAFLMVFRIGLVKEVIEKLEQATDVVFSTSAWSKRTAVKRRQRRVSSANRSTSNISTGSFSSIQSNLRSSQTSTRSQDSRSVNAMSLSLQSLPGISTFTDRAVIGMLKSFAGIHRDKKILEWNDDFRLGAGVGAFKISMIYGMDAGWAIEGAVGSEYKIDATYLSPHVNMASRMTSACKQYDVNIMLSQSVQELMSDVAQSKLRHIDTVTVKGSSVKQKIFTYDTRARGVDFFLHSRTEDQADLDADRYSPSIWSHDQDLKAMRQHISEEFWKVFKEGHKAYIGGNWPSAIDKLERANDIMFQTAIDDGYLEEEFDALNLRAGSDIQKASDELKRENGDGPSIYLISFMKSYGGVAPPDWEGWHPLTRK